jgi:hypothetical protein
MLSVVRCGINGPGVGPDPHSGKTNIKTISNGGKTLTKNEKEKRNKQFEYINRLRDSS